MDYTTTALLASIRRRASIPNTATTGSLDADLLSYANEILQTELAAEIIKIREDYILYNFDITLDGSREYRLNKRIMGGRIKSVQLLDGSSEIMTILTETDEVQIGAAFPISAVYAYRMRGDYIRLEPGTVTSAVTLRILAYLRPAELKVTGGTGIQAITAINTSTNVVTVASAASFGTTIAVDLVKGTPIFDPLILDTLPTAKTSTTVTFTSLPVGLAVGDYICLSDTAVIPQIPEPYHPVLAQWVAAKYWESLGAAPQAGAAYAQLSIMKKAADAICSPRNDHRHRKQLSFRGSFMGYLGINRYRRFGTN